MDVETIEESLLTPCEYCHGVRYPDFAQINRARWPELNLGDACWPCMSSGFAKDCLYSDCGHLLEPDERATGRCSTCL